MEDERASVNTADHVDNEGGIQATNQFTSLSSSTFFSGPIPLAIATAQRESKILMVSIGGDDVESKKLEETTWRDPKLLEEVHQSAVALQLRGSSDDAKNFSALYPVRVVPSITFVGCNGSLLYQHEGYVNSEELLEKLRAAREATELLFQNAAASAILAALSSARLPTDSTMIPLSSSVKECSTSQNSEISKEKVDASNDFRAAGTNKVETRKSDLEHVVQNPSQPVGLASPSIDVSARSSYINSNLATGNPSRLLKRVSTSFEDEIAKVQSQDPEGLFGTDSEMNIKGDCKDNLEAAEVLTDEHMKATLEDVLLQIRLPNGQVIHGQFKRTDCLKVVMDLVDHNDKEMSNYSLAIPFPRKVFTTEDVCKSLSELRIESRAALIVVPVKKIGRQGPTSVVSDSTTATENSMEEEQSSSGSFLGRALSYINPLSYLSWVFGERHQASQGPSTWQYDPNPTYERPARDGTPTQTDKFSSVSNIRKFSGPQSGTVTQRRGWGTKGNIHTLDPNEEDMPGKSNTYWNGNSTQFGGDDESKR